MLYFIFIIFHLYSLADVYFSTPLSLYEKNRYCQQGIVKKIVFIFYKNAQKKQKPSESD